MRFQEERIDAGHWRNRAIRETVTRKHVSLWFRYAPYHGIPLIPNIPLVVRNLAATLAIPVSP